MCMSHVMCVCVYRQHTRTARTQAQATLGFMAHVRTPFTLMAPHRGASFISTSPSASRALWPSSSPSNAPASCSLSTMCTSLPLLLAMCLAASYANPPENPEGPHICRCVGSSVHQSVKGPPCLHHSCNSLNRRSACAQAPYASTHYIPKHHYGHGEYLAHTLPPRAGAVCVSSNDMASMPAKGACQGW